MLFFRKILSCLLGVIFVAGFAAVAFSQDYPTKTITLEVGMEPGGIVDVATRFFPTRQRRSSARTC